MQFLNTPTRHLPCDFSIDFYRSSRPRTAFVFDKSRRWHTFSNSRNPKQPFHTRTCIDNILNNLICPRPDPVQHNNTRVFYYVLGRFGNRRRTRRRRTIYRAAGFRYCSVRPLFSGSRHPDGRPMCGDPVRNWRTRDRRQNTRIISSIAVVIALSRPRPIASSPSPPLSPYRTTRISIKYRSLTYFKLSMKTVQHVERTTDSDYRKRIFFFFF